MPGRQVRLLRQLARQYGIETSYRDYAGCRRQVGPQTLLGALRALGAPLEKLSCLPQAMRQRRQDLWRRCSEPAAVAWEGEEVALDLRLPASLAPKTVECRLELEKSETLCWDYPVESLPVILKATVEGEPYELRKLVLPAGLPLGYHRFCVKLPGLQSETTIIAAPRQAYTLPGVEIDRKWGLFLPLYALRSGSDWGAGNFTGWQGLLDWIKGQGGGISGTLPLLAAFLDVPFAPGPYEPVSRLFWNEFYLDLDSIDEIKQSQEALDTMASSGFLAEKAALRGEPLVDYGRGMALRRRILECGARTFFSQASGRRAVFEDWLNRNQLAEDYAGFRAAVEKQRGSWPDWPERMKDGSLREGDFERETQLYHLYVQWLTSEQFGKVAGLARQNEQLLYLDLPLGVHRQGYDVWRERSAFALGASAGAPPDDFYSQGQDWGFPPLHPEGIREQGYRYHIACLRHHFEHAGLLRVDHVMGMHRLYWVPAGLSAREGVYVRYRNDEFYAVLSLESRRFQVPVVGEDLGIVPDSVRAAMAGHSLHRMYVLPFEFTTSSRCTLRPVPEKALACLNTHDMPPFAVFWDTEGMEPGCAFLEFLYQEGYLEKQTAETVAVMRACLSYLAASRAEFLLINLEDLWLESAAQNVPGTVEEHPNWRRKARYTLDEFKNMPAVVSHLKEIDKIRKAAAGRRMS